MPTQNTDITGSPYAITYMGPGETWKIGKGVAVQGDAAGVYSAYANSTLKNKGTIYGETGVMFDALGALSDFVIKNQKKGEIIGEYGVVVASFVGSAYIQNKGDIDALEFGIGSQSTGSVEVVNKGDVSGGTAGFYAIGSSDIAVDNYGDLSGNAAGVALVITTPGTQGPMIHNYKKGMIEGFEYGVLIIGNTGVQAKIVNDKGAVIDGAQFGIVSQESLKLVNKGKIEGNVATADYDDKIINKGKIKGDVALGEGNDIFKNKGKKGKSDLIDTQDGNDLVVLGKKVDKLLFDSALNAATNVDTVKKFDSGKDMVYLDDDIFTTITPGTLSSAQFHKGTSAADADDRIIYDKSSGALYYDPDGAGGAAQVQFAKFDPGTKLKASDFSVGEYSLLAV